MLRYVLALILFGLLFPQSVLALGVSPSLHDLNLDPGEKSGFTLELHNDQTQAHQYLIEARDISFDQSGQISFKDQASNAGSTLWWLKFDKGPYQIAPQATERVNIEVSVPERVDPGGHYAALVVTQLKDPAVNDASMIGLQSQVASLIYINVNGEVHRFLSLDDFSAAQTFFDSKPYEFNLQIKNTGNTHLKPRGVVAITSQWTHRTADYKAVLNQDSRYLMPQQSQFFNIVWDDHLPFTFFPRHFGPYTAEVRVDAVQTSAVFARTTFWVIPAKFTLSLAALVLGFLILLIGYTKFIISRHNS